MADDNRDDADDEPTWRQRDSASMLPVTSSSRSRVESGSLGDISSADLEGRCTADPTREHDGEASDEETGASASFECQAPEEVVVAEEVVRTACSAPAPFTFALAHPLEAGRWRVEQDVSVPVEVEPVWPCVVVALEGDDSLDDADRAVGCTCRDVIDADHLADGAEGSGAIVLCVDRTATPVADAVRAFAGPVGELSECHCVLDAGDARR